jgi:hypothetical protein
MDMTKSEADDIAIEEMHKIRAMAKAMIANRDEAKAEKQTHELKMRRASAVGQLIASAHSKSEVDDVAIAKATIANRDEKEAEKIAREQKARRAALVGEFIAGAHSGNR